MFVATVSLGALLAGVISAVRAASRPARARARCEAVGGSLLATGLMLLGAGLQSAMG